MRPRPTVAQLAEVQGLRAAGLTHAAIEERTGIPRRTVSRLLAKHPVSEALQGEVAADMLSRLISAQERALAAVQAAVDDPKARLGDKATALRVLSEQRQLLEGRATANIAIGTPGAGDARAMLDDLTDEQREAFRDAIDNELLRRQYGPVALILEELARLTPDQEVELAHALAAGPRLLPAPPPALLTDSDFDALLEAPNPWD